MKLKAKKLITYVNSSDLKALLNARLRSYGLSKKKYAELNGLSVNQVYYFFTNDPKRFTSKTFNKTFKGLGLQINDDTKQIEFTK